MYRTELIGSDIAMDQTNKPLLAYTVAIGGSSNYSSYRRVW